MDLIQIFNLIEAAWWFAVAALLMLRPFRRDSRRLRLLLAVVLFLFGASDIVEVWTGAWWRPWWLAAWKIGCVMGIAALIYLWFRRSPRDAPRLTPFPSPDTMP